MIKEWFDLFIKLYWSTWSKHHEVISSAPQVWTFSRDENEGNPGYLLVPYTGNRHRRSSSHYAFTYVRNEYWTYMFSSDKNQGLSLYIV